MTQQHTPDRAGDDPLEDIVAGCLEVPPNELRAALDRACNAHPDSAAEIRARVRVLSDLGLVRAESVADDERFPERLGDFRLRERLGGGGMGVVFRARQESLGREVALKLIRPEQLYFPRARERFRREIHEIERLYLDELMLTADAVEGLTAFREKRAPQWRNA